MSKYEIESLKEGTILMGDLQKVGWVVLKSGFIIKPHSLLEDALYDLNFDVRMISCIGLALTNVNVKCITNNRLTLMIQGLWKMNLLNYFMIY